MIQGEYFEILFGVDEPDISSLGHDKVPSTSGKVCLIPMVVLLVNEKKFQKLIDGLDVESLEKHACFFLKV